MSIEFVCPTCSGTLRVGDESAGRVIRCGACLTMLRVPETGAEPAPAPDPAPGDASATPPSPFENAPDAPAAAVPVARPRARPRDDRDDRPRQRRRRPPPPSSPGRVLMWIGLVGGLIMLLTCGCCGGLFVALPDAKWQKHESAKGGFKVDLPAPPRKDMDKLAGGTPDPNMTIEGTVLVRRLEEYAVVYGDLPPRERQQMTDKEILDGKEKALTDGGELGPVLSRKDITVNGFPGREVEFSAQGGGYFATRIIIADGRVYALVAGGKMSAPGNANVRRFLDSFEIADPKLKASGDQKQAAAKRAEEQQNAWRQQQEQARLAFEKSEAERKAAEEEKRKEVARVAEEKRKAEDARRQAATAEAETFRAGRPGKAPPNPGELPGLVLHLPFDTIKGGTTPTATNETANLPAGATTGPGVRGPALYLAASPGGVTTGAAPFDLFSGKPVTVAGWVKTRDRAWCDLFVVPNVHDGRPLLRAGFTDTGVWAQEKILLPGARTGDARNDRPLHVSRPPDDRWHHLALVRRNVGTRTVVTLYLDGAPVTAFPFGGAEAGFSSFGQVAFGRAVPLGAFSDKPSEFAFTRQRDGHYDVPDHDLPVAAIDDVCAYDRALADAEVRFLAGAGPKPGADPKPVQLVRAATIDANNGVAFDPDRGAVWAVTAVAPSWRFEPAPKAAPRLSYLRSYSYPDFVAGDRYLLPSSEGSIGVGGPPAIDAKRNRLFVPISYEFAQQARTSLQRPWEPFDQKQVSLHRFALDNLPEAKGAGAPPLTSAVSRGGLFEELLGVAFAPDGARVYYLDGGPLQHTNRADYGGLAVSGVDADLGGRQKVTVPRTATWKGAFWMSPDGKTLRTITSGKGNADAPEGAGVLEVDTATWKAKVIPLDGVNWKLPQSSAWHPDGRLFISDGPFGILEFDLVSGTRRVRPVPLPGTESPWSPTSFLQVSADGRYLVASETEQKIGPFAPAADLTKNRVFVLDASRDAAQLGALGTIEETADRRVGGPCWVSPDGRFVAFRSGVVLRIDDGRPLPKPVSRVPVAPAPRPVERE